MGKSIALLGALPFPEIPSHLHRRGMVIEPCPTVGEWALEMFLEPGSAFYNPEHEILEKATIGWLWSNVENGKSGKTIIGTAQIGTPQGGTPWAKARQYEQLERWFGFCPDFLITLDAVFLSVAIEKNEPEAICALIEHELYHCAPKRDKYGEIVWDDEDKPRWIMRPHDVEEFIGVVDRYGAWDKDLRDFRDALNKEPRFGRVKLSGLCGVCHG